MNDIPLPNEAKSVVWKIFGAGSSPLNALSSFDLIQPVLRKHVSSSSHRDQAISVIRGWFDNIGGRRYLSQGIREQVAMLILDGVGNDFSETAIWAIGSIDRDLSANIIRSCWSKDEIAVFIDAVLATLESLCARDEVLDVSGIAPVARSDSYKTSVPRESLQREGNLETFQHLNNFGFELIQYALHGPTGNLIELVVELRPELFESLIEMLDHPVMQARAALHVITASRIENHRRPLEWISKNSCDALIALSIVHTLETVNRLDEDIRSADHLNESQAKWSTELHPARDDLDAAADALINDVVVRLTKLEPLVCARWIGELLSRATFTLIQVSSEKSPRIEKLETTGQEQLARLVREAWRDELLERLCVGLRLSPRSTWPRHLAAVAWMVRDVEPVRAVTLAQVALDELELWIAKELRKGHLFLDWDDWHYREWINSLGAALALSNREEHDLLNWVSNRCRSLPLVVWDAEENLRTFSAANRAAQTWFLVAFHSIECLKVIEQEIDCVEVLALAEAVWNHCYFAEQYTREKCEESVVVEFASRFAVEYGEPGYLWLLEQAQSQKVGPRALWAIVDQRQKRANREKRRGAGNDDEIVIDEFTRGASDRFGDGRLFGFEALQYWGHLWLLLKAAKEAYQTAETLLNFPIRDYERRSKILLLELLCFGAEAQRVDQEIAEYVDSTYRALWPTLSHTPDMEQEDRQRINSLLERMQYTVS